MLEKDKCSWLQVFNRRAKEFQGHMQVLINKDSIGLMQLTQTLLEEMTLDLWFSSVKKMTEPCSSVNFYKTYKNFVYTQSILK